jgi:hypothetical protein
LFQSFPYTYRFTGSKTEATKQIGNAFPPTMAEALYRTISKTLEAFDNNLIGAEDDLSDLDALLERKGVRLVRAPTVTSSYPDPTARKMSLPYRYLVRDETNNSSIATPSASSPFASKKETRFPKSHDGNRAAFPSMSMGLAAGLLEDYTDLDMRKSVGNRRHRHVPVAIDGDEDDVVWLSESETDSD